MEAAPVKEVTPEKQEVPYNPAPLAENDVKDTKGFDAEELPKTASEAPLFAGLGLLMIAGAFWLVTPGSAQRSEFSSVKIAARAPIHLGRAAVVPQENPRIPYVFAG